MAIVVLVLVVIVVVAMFILFPQNRPKWISNKPSNSDIRILIPLAESVGFSQETFLKEYMDRWGNKAFCESIENDEIYDTQCLVTDPSHNSILSLKYSSVPLDTDITNLLLSRTDRGFTDSKALTDEEKMGLLQNTAFIEIQCEIGQRATTDSIEFIAKTLLSIFQNQPAIGYANSSAQSYRPKSKLIEFQSKSKLSRPDLFLLFVNIQTVSDEQVINIHTHGMEQFKLPDLQVLFTERSETNYHFNVLRTAAVYIVEKGDTLKRGNTWQLEGDRTIFRIIPVKKDEMHFGSYGTIGLERTVAPRKG